MPAVISDQQISELLACPKEIALADLKQLKKPRQAKGSANLSIKSRQRHFRIVVNRPKSKNKNKFSIILQVARRGKWFNLIRCNGHHAPHENTLEKMTIPANTFHIHRATERYQLAGRDPETYAEPTDKYDSPDSAIEFMCNNFGFVFSDLNTKLHPLWD